MAFTVEFLIKLFSDVKTLIDCDKDLNTPIERFVLKVKPVIKPSGLNGSKNYFMFVAIRKEKQTDEISIKFQISVTEEEGTLKR